LGSVQSADIQLIKNKAAGAAAAVAGRQAGKQTSCNSTKGKETKWMAVASNRPTDRPGPTHKTTASYFLLLFFIQLATLPPQ